ncbi:MAG: hypothetical protein WCO92_02715 [Verrucomicrobiota bacterium]
MEARRKKRFTGMEAIKGIKHTCGVAAAGSTAEGSPAGASLAGASKLQSFKKTNLNLKNDMRIYFAH